MYEKLEEYIDNLFEDDNTPKNQLKDWAYGAIDFAYETGMIDNDEAVRLKNIYEL